MNRNWLFSMVFLIALALSTSLAEAHQRRVRVPAESVIKRETRQQYMSDDTLLIRVWINGRERRQSAYVNRSTCTRGWAGRGVLVEANSCENKGPIRFRVSNLRSRTAKVRISYRLWTG